MTFQKTAAKETSVAGARKGKGKGKSKSGARRDAGRGEGTGVVVALRVSHATNFPLSLPLSSACHAG